MRLHGNVTHLKITDQTPSGSNFDGYIILASDGTGALRHLEIHTSKAGSTIHGLTNTVEAGINNAIEAGSLEALLQEMETQTYSPRGATDDPEVPTCTSLAHYLAQKIRLHNFIQTPQSSPT